MPHPYSGAQKLLLAWAVVVLLPGCWAAESAEGPPQFSIRRWTTQEGLPQNRVGCIKQTRDGYLWIGTWAGLARFNGMNFAVFNRHNTPALVNDAINSLAEDTDGTLWIATQEGLVKFRAGLFRRVSVPGPMPDPNILRLATSRLGGIWLQIGGAVARLTSGGFSSAWLVETNNQPSICGLVEGADGGVNIFTGRAWLTISPTGDRRQTNFVHAADKPRILAGWPGETPGLAWAATEEGLAFLRAGQPNTFSGDQLKEQRASSIYQDRAHNWWVGTTRGGLFHRSAGSWSSLDLGLGGTVICLEDDREGNLWVGSSLGLVQVRKFSVRTYTTRDGLANNSVLSVCEGTDGAIWAGTDHGLSGIRDGKVSALGVAEPLLDWPDRSLWPAADGGVLISKAGAGLFEYHKGEFIERFNRASLPGDLNVLYRDTSTRLWVGGNRGVLAFDAKVPWHPCVAITNASMRDVRSVLQSRDGDLWFGTKRQGLVRFRNGEWKTFTTREGLSDDRVWSLLEDAEGMLWIGTDNGFNRYKDGRVFSFTSRQGLPEGTINCVLADNAGDLWLSGLRGIHRAHRRELNAVADGRAPTAQFISLGIADGMENPETNGGENQPAGWKARDGRLWFPTVLGVVVIDPDAVPHAEPAPRVVIEQVRADNDVVFGLVDRPDSDDSNSGSTVSGPTPSEQHSGSGVQSADSPLRLLAGHGHVLEFKYTANTFVAPERARFRYRLVGAEPDWREETSEHTVHYINLKPGDYRFEVIGANHHNVWSTQPATLSFSLAPHFWQTWTCYLLCGAGLVGVASAVLGYRLRWQRRLLKAEQQRALATERTRIARDLHDDLGTALTGLALELDVVSRESRNGSPVSLRLSDAAQSTRGLAERMREVVWTVNPRCDTVSSLASFLEQQVSQFLGLDGLKLHLDFPEDIPDLPLGAGARHQLALSVREALTNVVRHARATEVVVSLTILDAGSEAGQLLLVKVVDNGRGFQHDDIDGQGLVNMHARLEQVGGSFDCASSPGSGTTLTFRLPLQPK